MARRLALSALAVAGALLVGGVWLAATGSGLQTAAQLAEGLSGRRLQIASASGRLVGPLQIGRLRWQDAELQVEAEELALDWSPAALLRGHLAIARLQTATLAVTHVGTATPTPVPTDLGLPLTVNAEKVQISKFLWNAGTIIQDIDASLHSDGRQHHLELRQARLADARLSGRASLETLPPFALQAHAELTGTLEARPLALTLAADGPLERIALRGEATQGLSGKLSATLTPFAPAPFAQARLMLKDIDPAAWQAGAPPARLDLVAEIAPDGDDIIGSFGLSNQRPGPLDRPALPLATLAGSFAWRDGSLQFDQLHASQARQGSLAGQGRWQDGQLTLALTARQLDAAQIATALHPTRLDGPLTASIGSTTQALTAELRDARFALQAEARHNAGRIDLSRLRLAAGDAHLDARGWLDLGASQGFALTGLLHRFDPSRFGRLPMAELNAEWQADGQLHAPSRINGRFRLADSRLAGQPLHGQGQIDIRWPQQALVDIALDAGANRLSAQGAFGRPDDRLKIVIAAPQLAPYGLGGSLAGEGELSGGTAQPRLQGRLTADRLALPGGARLDGLRLAAELGTAAHAPLSLDLAVDRLSTSDQPEILRSLTFKAEGTNAAHQLRLSSRLLGTQRLQLAAQGGLTPTPANWQGQLTEATLDGKDAARNFRLIAPAPLRIGGNGWQGGPFRLAGTTLDWQGTINAHSDGRRLQAELQVSGSRIGQVSGELRAAQDNPWSLARTQAWQGQLRADVPDLAWLGELIGEGWRSEGQLKGEMLLAGTPAYPSLSGSLRGTGLGLRQIDQGLHLNRGELDIALRENRLRINRAVFESPWQKPPRALRLAAGEALEQLTAQPGRLDVSGETLIDLSRGAEQAQLDFRLARIGVFQQPEQWVALSGSGRLNWQGGQLGARGRLAVDAGYWRFAPGGTPRLSDDVVVRRAGDDSAPPTLRPRLDIDLEADLGEHFLFSGAGLDSRLAGALRLQAQGRDLPRASGTIRTVGGRFDAYGQKLEIERGVLSFNGLLDNPGLDVRAVRKGLSVEPGVQIGGTARKPTIRLISDPELPEAEKLAWLVLGHGPEQMGAGDASVLLSAAGGLLGNDAGNVVQQIKRSFGLDELGVRQGSIGDSGSRQASSRVAGSRSVESTSTGQQIVSLGRRLSSNALLSYEQALGKAEGIVKLTVNLNRRVAVIGRAGSDNALDVFYTLTFGGAAEKPVGQ